MRRRAPAWLQSHYPAALTYPRIRPIPPPPSPIKDYSPEELEWLAHVMADETPVWLHKALRRSKK